MMLLPCPWCGLRNSDEFGYIGETSDRPDPGRVNPEEWRAYLYTKRNTCGWTTESWYHRAGCRQYIVVERHTERNVAKVGS